MGQKKLNGLGLTSDFVDRQKGWGKPVNENFDLLDGTTNAGILGFIDTLPTTAIDGDRYIVNSTGNIAIYESGWVEHAPRIGMRSYDINDDKLYFYGSSGWKEFEGGGGSSGSVNEYSDKFTSDGTQTQFVLSDTPSSIEGTVLIIGTVIQEIANYTIDEKNEAGDTLLTLSEAPVSGQTIILRYHDTPVAVQPPVEITTQPQSIRTVSANADFQDSDDNLFVDASSGDIVIGLPNAFTAVGKPLTIKKVDSTLNKVTIQKSNAAFVTTLNTECESVDVISNGIEWFILNREIPRITNVFTPTINWVNNITFGATWMRLGDSVQFDMTIFCNGTPQQSANNFLAFDLPTGLVMDTSKMPTGGGRDKLGTIFVLDVSSTANRISGTAEFNSSTRIVFTSDGHANVSTTNPFSFTTNDSFAYNSIPIPIVGWKG